MLISILPNSLDHIRTEFPTSNRRTKIVCTLGPACWSVEGLINLIDAGMNVARFNFSHGDHISHYSTLERLREAVAARPGSNIAVMLGETIYPSPPTTFLRIYRLI